jgi:putative transposase
VPQTMERALADPHITRVSDEAWEAVQPILDEYDPPRRLGRKRIDQRRALDAIVYRLRSGCRWNHLPKDYPDDSSVHRTYQRWQRLGVLDRVLDTLGERTNGNGHGNGHVNGNGHLS